ncbi:MAG: carboxypeptidase-like regulatory domain-containing protein [Cyclobacteriaceae bacterium]|nr:carboxypeptidase-like regulatory domain-containing protein [Cyclobacteriaceae bacterium]
MKRAIAIWIFRRFFVSAARSQEVDSDQRIALEFTDVTLKEALDSIAVHFHLRMSYSDSKINSARKVSGRYSATSQQDFLSQFLNDQDLNYTIIDDQIVVFPFNTNQTIKISGRVTGAEDGEPVAFASITLPDVTKGTSTNEEGEFELDVTELPIQITVSHIAYEKQMIFVYEDRNLLQVRLNQAPAAIEGIDCKRAP